MSITEMVNQAGVPEVRRVEKPGPRWGQNTYLDRDKHGHLFGRVKLRTTDKRGRYVYLVEMWTLEIMAWFTEAELVRMGVEEHS